VKYAPDSIEGRFLAGEPEAVGTVSRWIASVLTDLRHWGLWSEWADLHQDVLAGVLSSLRDGRFDPRRDLRSYVMAIARFTIRHSVRQRPRRPAATLLVSEGRSGTAVTSPESAALRGLAVRHALAELPQVCRELIEAYFFEQRDAEEIAAAQNIPVGTVKSRLFRCLEHARRELQAARYQGIRPTTPHREREPKP
jgi:RNA polymerase sigma factor (sigma-70 family)